MNKERVTMTISSDMLELLDDCKGRLSRSSFAEELMIIGMERLTYDTN